MSVTTFELKSNETDGWETQTGVDYLARKQPGGCILSLSVPLGTWRQRVRVTYAGGYVLPGGAPAYVSRPSTGQNWPVVLIAQEIFGLHEHIRDVARRFAKLGYFAIAPDYLILYGDPAAAPDIDAIRAIVARVPDAVTLAAFDEALAFAATQGGDATRAAVTGFCWGGRIAWLYANRKLIGGLTFVEEPEVLRFFYGLLKPVSDWQNHLVAKFREDFGDSL